MGRKGSRVSFTGRVLGRLQAALLLCNPIGIHVSHIPTSEDVIAGTLSRVPSKSTLLTTFPSWVQILR